MSPHYTQEFPFYSAWGNLHRVADSCNNYNYKQATGMKLDRAIHILKPGG